MATAFTRSYGRRLSDLLQEQQEPFLLDAFLARSKAPRPMRCPVAACKRLLRLCNHGFKKRRRSAPQPPPPPQPPGGSLRCALSRVLCSRAMRRVLRWDGGAVLGCCFSGAGAGGGEEARFPEFRRLSRSGDIGDDGAAAAMDSDEEADWRGAAAGDSSRQLSPVSVLELRSDGGSPVHGHWDEDEKPSTSGSSGAAEDDLQDCPIAPTSAKACAMEVEEKSDQKSSMPTMDMEEEIMWASWERIAGDISRIPMLVEQELWRSMEEWRRCRAEVAQIGSSIERLIFEDMRREAVCDMLSSH